MAELTDPVDKLKEIVSDDSSSNTIVAIAQAIMKVNAKIGTHIGNPNAHLIIDPNNDSLSAVGYMSKAGFVPKYVARAAVGIPQAVSGVDPVTLKPGFYKGYSLTNLPDSVNSLGEQAWLIEMHGQGKDDIQSLMMVGSPHGSTIRAKKVKGTWYWDSPDKGKTFIPDQNGSTYSVVVLNTKRLVDINLNLDTSLPAGNFAKVYAHMSSMLIPKDNVPFNGYVETENGTFGPCYGIFSPNTAITVWNDSNQNSSKIHAHFMYLLDK